jgi:ADP-heptose:LPS heptosyltransferase
MDFLTLADSSRLLKSLRLFDNVYEFPKTTTIVRRLAATMQIAWLMRSNRYEALLDLQRNWVTRAIRRSANTVSWSEFNRFAEKAAALRVTEAVRQLGFPLHPLFKLNINDALTLRARQLLIDAGWQRDTPLIVLNPSGLWTTRNWPVENYLELSRLCLREFPVQFLLLGTNRIRQKAEFLKSHLGDAVVNLVGQTTLEEAFASLQFVAAVVSEDSGLMHMATALNIPIVALFGSSRHVWSAPQGPSARVFHSGDLECGSCMQPECRYGDVHCLTRYSSNVVFGSLVDLLQKRISAYAGPYS